MNSYIFTNKTGNALMSGFEGDFCNSHSIKNLDTKVEFKEA